MNDGNEAEFATRINVHLKDAAVSLFVMWLFYFFWGEFGLVALVSAFAGGVLLVMLTTSILFGSGLGDDDVLEKAREGAGE